MKQKIFNALAILALLVAVSAAFLPIPRPQPLGVTPGSLVSTTNATFDIGSLAKQWRNAWFSGNITGGTLLSTTLTSPTITSPSVTGGTFSSPTITGTAVVATANITTLNATTVGSTGLIPSGNSTLLGNTANRFNNPFFAGTTTMASATATTSTVTTAITTTENVTTLNATTVGSTGLIPSGNTTLLGNTANRWYDPFFAGTTTAATVAATTMSGNPNFSGTPTFANHSVGAVTFTSPNIASAIAHGMDGTPTIVFFSWGSNPYSGNVTKQAAYFVSANSTILNIALANADNVSVTVNWLAFIANE